jgi:hypothetical protein
MTVEELIEQLKKCPQNARVEIVTSSQGKPRNCDVVREIANHRPGVEHTKIVELRPLT